MEWKEIRITCESELTDVLSEILVNHTGRGLVIEDAVPSGKQCLKAYLPLDSSFSERMLVLENLLQPFIDRAALDTDIIPDQDWGHNWKEFFKPQVIGKKIVIKPSWSDFQGNPDQVIIEIDPGMAFGTGTHSSTRLVLETLEQALARDQASSPLRKVLDVGTGTGILAMAAAGLGADKVCAIDVDPEAVAIALENVRLNGLEHRISVSGSPLESIYEEFSIVLANIIYSELVCICPDLYRVTEPGGLLIASGILNEQAPGLISVYQRHGFISLSTSAEGEWTCLTFRRDFR